MSCIHPREVNLQPHPQQEAGFSTQFRSAISIAKELEISYLCVRWTVDSEHSCNRPSPETMVQSHLRQMIPVSREKHQKHVYFFCAAE